MTLGRSPPGRFMHTMDHCIKGNSVVLYGGRNDQLSTPILSDLWILKLDNLEWVEAKVGGQHLAIPRFNHASFMNDSELIICGGQNRHFSYEKDYLTIELDQLLVDRINPIMGILAIQIRAKLVNINKKSLRACIQKR